MAVREDHGEFVDFLSLLRRRSSRRQMPDLHMSGFRPNWSEEGGDGLRFVAGDQVALVIDFGASQKRVAPFASLRVRRAHRFPLRDGKRLDVHGVFDVSDCGGGFAESKFGQPLGLLRRLKGNLDFLGNGQSRASIPPTSDRDATNSGNPAANRPMILSSFIKCSERRVYGITR